MATSLEPLFRHYYEQAPRILVSLDLQIAALDAQIAELDAALLESCPSYGVAGYQPDAVQRTEISDPTFKLMESRRKRYAEVLNELEDAKWRVRRLRIDRAQMREQQALVQCLLEVMSEQDREIVRAYYGQSGVSMDAAGGNLPPEYVCAERTVARHLKALATTYSDVIVRLRLSQPPDLTGNRCRERQNRRVVIRVERDGVLAP